MRIVFPVAAMAGCFLLSACMGTSTDAVSGVTGGGVGDTSGALSVPDMMNAVRDYDATQNQIDNGSLKPAADPTGTASMTGVMGVVLPNDPNNTDTILAAGKLAMDVDFDAATVTGKATDLGQYNETQQTYVGDLSGSLDIKGNVVNTNQIDAQATGTLSTGSETGNVDLNMTGTVYDNSGKLLAHGTMQGTLTDATGTSQLNEGAFQASE